LIVSAVTPGARGSATEDADALDEPDDPDADAPDDEDPDDLQAVATSNPAAIANARNLRTVGLRVPRTLISPLTSSSRTGSWVRL